MERQSAILILEDDAVFSASFARDIQKFFCGIPQDWDGLMLGGESVSEIPVCPGIVRCLNCQRTHAYAVRGRYMSALYQHLISSAGHCDHRAGEIQNRFKVYAPKPFIVGQRDGESDISGTIDPLRFWHVPPMDAPVILLRCAAELLPRLKAAGFYCGKRVDVSVKCDAGLTTAFAMPLFKRAIALRAWIEMIQWEVASQLDRMFCTVWHPEASREILAAVTAAPIFEIVADTVEQAIAQLPTNYADLEDERRDETTVLLDAPRQVMEELRSCGFHSGHWRDRSTGEDYGLTEALEEECVTERRAMLRKWFDTLRREARAANGVVTVWHHKATEKDLKEAIDLPICKIRAHTSDEALRSWTEYIGSQQRFQICPMQ